MILETDDDTDHIDDYDQYDQDDFQEDDYDYGRGSKAYQKLQQKNLALLEKVYKLGDILKSRVPFFRM